ncbi:MAG: sugar ABC transporter ATP-binding protein, partial [Armatimonadota bacterium]|nr:sugar ABC transporter ATP-binding protein [Armatimonadota bacterium]
LDPWREQGAGPGGIPWARLPTLSSKPFRMGAEKVDVLLKVEGISKSFPGVKALEDVDLELRRGEVHGLLGENGAGKTTLMRILTGIYRKDTGRILLEGREVEITDPSVAKSLGIAMIHQELSLFPNLSVAENILFGREPTRPLSPFVDFAAAYAHAREILQMLGDGIDPQMKVGRLSFGDQQKVEIARALSMNAKILIMDEATSGLAVKEIERLFELIRSLKGKGISIIYITHRIDEVFEICDRVTVLRDGRVVGTADVQGISKQEIIRWITGRTIEAFYPKEAALAGEVVLAVEGLSTAGTGSVNLTDIHFRIRKGEILGITGLLGAGKTEVCKALWGMERVVKGKIWIEGKEVRIRTPYEAQLHGLAYVPEDRRTQGLISEMSVAANLTLPKLHELSRMLFFIDGAKEAEVTKRWMEKLRIAARSPRQKVKALSGGNQQKVVIAKWLETKPKVLLVDEPTKGIDVGAKVEVRRLLSQLAQEGMAILLASSDVEEVLSIADVILVLYKGRVTGRFPREEATKDRVMACAMGLEERVTTL